MTDISTSLSRSKKRWPNLFFFLIGIILTTILDNFVLPSRIVGQNEVASAKTIRNGSSLEKEKCALHIEAVSTDTKKEDHAPIQEAGGSLGYGSSILDNQIRRQELFQQLIHRNQNPIDCRTRRILFTHDISRPQDGFTLEVQLFARYLQAGMAMDRTFIFRDNFKTAYAPPGCQWSTINMTNVTNTWNCLYEPPSNCTENMVKAKIRNEQGEEFPPPNKVNASSKFMMTHGLHPSRQEQASRFYNSQFYGSTRIIPGLDFAKPATRYWYADVLEHWDRVMGRFWIRAQMVHYLWRPSVGLKSEMELRMPKTLLDEDDPQRFIGMHIRFTDNVKHFLDDFGRDARVTRSLDHFMDIAREIRNETGISNIYLATDSTKALEDLRDSKYSEQGWSFHIQNDVIRSDSEQLMWFKRSRGSMAAAIATDVEVLKRADYIIGSYQSNVFRLATELNTAYQVAKYPLDVNRHRTVDIEWYEDP